MYDGYIDGLYEREKRILCILGAVCAAASGIFIAPPSKFYGVYFGSKSGLLVIFAAIMSFLYAAVFLIISGTAKRGRRLLSLEEAAKNTTHSSGYVSVYAMSRDSGASSSYKRRCKAANTAAVALILLTSVLMIILFTAGDVSYLLSEITKKPIDRTVSDFRIWADTFGKFIVFLALAMTLTAAPDVMRNRRVNKICLYADISLCIIGCIHIGYFFFGEIMNYPCFSDLLIVFMLSCCCGLCYLSILTERKKSLLKTMKNGEFNVY